MPPYSVERAHTPTRYRVCDPDRAPLAEPRGGPRPSRPPQMDREPRAVAAAKATGRAALIRRPHATSPALTHPQATPDRHRPPSTAMLVRWPACLRARPHTLAP